MISTETRLKMLEKMMLTRAYERKLLELIEQRMVGGFCSSMGQEACAVGAIEAMGADDLILTNHRSAGHILSRGADPGRMMAEVMGRATGYCKGKSGTLHISVKELGVYLTSTIVGGELSMVSGVGLSLSMLKPGKAVTCFFGDGASCEGVFHESLNIASVWNLPILYFCENNEWQAFVRREEAMKTKDIAKWASGYGIPTRIVDGNDVEAVYAATREAMEWIRAGKGPYFIEAKTYRQRGHFEPDTASYVPKEELESWLKRDPIDSYKSLLAAEGVLSPARLEQLESAVGERIGAAVKFAGESPFPSPDELCTDVYAPEA